MYRCVRVETRLRKEDEEEKERGNARKRKELSYTTKRQRDKKLQESKHAKSRLEYYDTQRNDKKR